MNEAMRLFNTIKKSQSEWVPGAIAAVTKCINVFVEYMNCVIDTEVYSRSIIEWTKTSEYIFKQKDEHRRAVHDMAVEACRTLNEICERFQLEHVCDFDLADRQQVAEFVGQTIYSIYNQGITKPHTFDEILEESMENGIVYSPVGIDQFDGKENL